MRIRHMMQELIALDAVIIVPAGNYAKDPNSWRRKPVRQRPDIDTVPAIWAGPSLPLIVVGAVDSSRRPGRFSQGPTGVSVYAPGVKVECAKPVPTEGLKLTSQATGTSYAAAMVSYQSR